MAATKKGFEEDEPTNTEGAALKEEEATNAGGHALVEPQTDVQVPVVAPPAHGKRSGSPSGKLERDAPLEQAGGATPRAEKSATPGPGGGVDQPPRAGNTAPSGSTATAVDQPPRAASGSGLRSAAAPGSTAAVSAGTQAPSRAGSTPSAPGGVKPVNSGSLPLMKFPTTPAPEPLPDLEELDEVSAAPPEADVVAARALMVSSLLRRSAFESTPDAAAMDALNTWVEENGLYGNLGPEGAELFDAVPGSWPDEALDAVAWSAEEAGVLAWALQRQDFPSLEARVDAAAVLRALPVPCDVDAMLSKATLRPVHEVEERLSVYGTLLEVVRSEAYVRSLQQDPASLVEDEELEQVLESAEREGFDRKAAAAKGKAHEAREALRFWTRTLLEELATRGLPVLDGAALVSMKDERLAELLGMTHARSEALLWLLEGDEYVDEAG